MAIRANVVDEFSIRLNKNLDFINVKSVRDIVNICMILVIKTLIFFASRNNAIGRSHHQLKSLL